MFERPDEGGDIVKRGAFAASLKSGREVPLLLQHKAGAIAGVIEKLEEDQRGLRVIARLGADALARRAAMLLGQGRLNGLSFGYRVKKAGKAGNLRTLDEVELVEVSLVQQPMQPRARVHAVEQ